MNSRGLIWDFPICRGSKKIPVIQHLMENMEAEETLWRPWSSLVSQSVSLSDKRRVPKPKVYVETCRNNVPLKGQGIANIVKCSLWLLQHRVGTKIWLCFVDNKMRWKLMWVPITVTTEQLFYWVMYLATWRCCFYLSLRVWWRLSNHYCDIEQDKLIADTSGWSTVM